MTKTFLTTVIGLAWQRGLIRDVNDYARDYMPPGVDLFEAEHNQKIKWEHLLRQTSDWQGTLWGKPDWADRPEGKTAADWPNRPLREPGTHFKYNDVRVNVMSLAALQVWRRPLPQVLREEVMEPIGASSTWRGTATRTPGSISTDRKFSRCRAAATGAAACSSTRTTWRASGICSCATASGRIARSCRRSGSQMARTPGPANANYGFANWYLNTERKPVPTAPATAVRFVGNGNNIIYIDWENDLVIVTRWSNGLNDLVGKTIASLKRSPTTAGQ